MSNEYALRIGFLIHDVSRLRRTLADKALRPLGVTRSQSWVLAFLHQHSGSGMTQTELARQLDVGKVTMGGLIDRLEERGYLERRADDIDRRARRIHMTPKGAALVKKIQVVSENLDAAILRGIPDKHVKMVEDVLSRVKNQLLDMDAVRGHSALDRSIKGD